MSAARSDNVTGARPALQARSKRTRDAILDAVKTAIDDDALDTATVHDLAAAAGVSIGAFYGRFENKEAAIVALFNGRRSAFTKKLIRLSENAASIENWAQKAVAIAMVHAKINKSLIARAARSETFIDTMKADARADSIALATALGDMLQRIDPSLPHEEAVKIAGFCVALLGGMTRDAVIFSASLLGGRATKKWFEQSLADAIVSYVNSQCQK